MCVLYMKEVKEREIAKKKEVFSFMTFKSLSVEIMGLAFFFFLVNYIICCFACFRTIFFFFL